ncbi:MAG: flagellar hook-length control protein FliK [Bacteroidales bacterium]|nr:flagellar hook-length control protein FliK [Lachnoclostridium sp.]MCM1385045.1 flagellar hook-length control protein FliK [Lachnoclostridium sp.]MCM1465323.1 flagellar hook-length control protein FliK [Bacteroidales bacterium]
MTVTSVKDAGSVLNSLTTNVAAKSAAQVQGASFKSVWDSQPKGESQQTSAKAPQEEQDAAKAGDSLKAKDSRNVKPAEEAKGVSETEETKETGMPEDSDNREEAMEVLGTAAVELLNRIADTLGVDLQNLQESLSEMELEPVDLLDAETLNGFLLKAMGAEDSTALLTDEGMYQDFNRLMGELETMLSEDSGVSGMTLGELKGQLEAQPEVPADMQTEIRSETQLFEAAEIAQAPAKTQKKEPVIEVSVERAAPKADAEDAVPEENQLQKAENTAGQTKDQGSDKAGEKHSGEKGQESSPFVQNTAQPVNSNVQAAQTTQPMAAWDVDTQDIMRQIMDYMRISVKPDMSQMEMQLHPANLGTLQIHVASKGGVLTANFVAQNEAVKAALESQMVQLKDNFAQQGVKVEAIEVTVQTHQFEENLEQGQQRNQGSSEKKQRTRRITLDGPLTMEELSAMDEEEQLAAEMMAASGSTVEYTA